MNLEGQEYLRLGRQWLQQLHSVICSTAVGCFHLLELVFKAAVSFKHSDDIGTPPNDQTDATRFLAVTS